MKHPREKGLHDAAVKGWKYHLVVKGFNCSDRGESIEAAVLEFLEKIFATESQWPSHMVTMRLAGKETTVKITYFK